MSNHAVKLKLHLGGKVEVEGKGRGTLLFVGVTKQSKGDKRAGIELETPTGKHNGTVNGVKYFNCKPEHGTIVKCEEVKIVAEKSLRNKLQQGAKGGGATPRKAAVKKPAKPKEIHVPEVREQMPEAMPAMRPRRGSIVAVDLTTSLETTVFSNEEVKTSKTERVEKRRTAAIEKLRRQSTAEFDKEMLELAELEVIRKKLEAAEADLAAAAEAEEAARTTAAAEAEEAAAKAAAAAEAEEAAAKAAAAAEAEEAAAKAAAAADAEEAAAKAAAAAEAEEAAAKAAAAAEAEEAAAKAAAAAEAEEAAKAVAEAEAAAATEAAEAAAAKAAAESAAAASALAKMQAEMAEMQAKLESAEAAKAEAAALAEANAAEKAAMAAAAAAAEQLREEEAAKAANAIATIAAEAKAANVAAAAARDAATAASLAATAEVSVAAASAEDEMPPLPPLDTDSSAMSAELESLREQLRAAEIAKEETAKQTKEKLKKMAQKVMIRLEGGQAAVDVANRDDAETRAFQEAEEQRRTAREAETERLRLEALAQADEVASKRKEAEAALAAVATEAARIEEERAAIVAADAAKEIEAAEAKAAAQLARTTLLNELVVTFRREWNSAKVCAWIGTAGFQKEANLIAEHDLEAEDLLVILEEDLQEMGCDDLKARGELFKLISRVKTRVASEDCTNIASI